MAKSEDTNKELSIEELKKMSGGMDAGDPLPNVKKTSFSQGQTSFSELSGIERNFKGKNKKADSLLDGQPEHG